MKVFPNLKRPRLYRKRFLRSQQSSEPNTTLVTLERKYLLLSPTLPHQDMDSPAPQVYSRKDKSLGVLVAKYLSLSLSYDSPDFDFLLFFHVSVEFIISTLFMFSCLFSVS